MDFANKEFLPLLIAPFFLAAVYSFRLRKSSKRLLKVFGARESWLVFRSSRLAAALSFAALCFFILSLARPQGPAKETEQEKSAALPLFIAIDVSLSMLAEDASPNRLEAAKRAAARFLDMFHEGPAALAAFAGHAALIAPFTDDRSLLRLFLKDLSSDYIENRGSDLRPLFSQIERAFEGAAARAAAKAVLIISDGESHNEGLLDSPSFQALLRKNVRFFALSVGESAGAPIPLRDSNGKLRGYKRDKKGLIVETKAQRKSLKELARLSHGAYYNMSGNPLPRLISDLKRLKKSLLSRGRGKKKKELYPYPLSLGAALALMAFFLPPRRRSSVKGRLSD